MRGLTVVIALAALAPCFAQERYSRDWSDHPGMPRQVWDVTHDDRGFLWLAGEEGVHRFDGQEIVHWGRVEGGSVSGINRGPGGRIVAFTEQGKAYEVVSDGLRRVAGPGDVEFRNVNDADYDGRGGLWIAERSGLYRRDPDETWTRIDVPELEGDTPLRLRGAADGGAYVGTWQGRFVRMSADGVAETWWSDPTGHIWRIAVKDERTQAFAVRFGSNHGVFLVEDGVVRPVYRSPDAGDRWTGMVFRDDTLWVAATGLVLAIRDGGRSIETMGPEQGMHLAGEASVDHENSLWLAAVRGLYQYPEPDVVLWTDMKGTRQVNRVGSDIVLGRWQGPHRLEPDGTWRDLTPPGYAVFDKGGASPWDTIWVVAVENPNTPQNRSALLEVTRDGWRKHASGEGGVFVGAYSTDADGVFWIGFVNTLWRVDGPGQSPRAVANLPFDKARLVGLTVDGARVRVASRDGPFCEGTLDAGRTALAGTWRCETVEGAGQLTDFKTIEGVDYLGTWNRGVARRDGGEWRTVVGERELDTPTVRGISASPAGGMWVISYLGRVRVVFVGDEARIVERLGPWMGVPYWMTFEALEEADGTVWLSGMAATMRIPAAARRRPVLPPAVYVTGFRADGRDLAPERSHELPAGTRRIELAWAAPAYRDPAALRYQVRVDASEDWAETRERSFHFVDLGSGAYRVEVRASLDGETWSAEPADFRFEIRVPWWLRTWFWGAALVAVAAVALSIQGLRARQQVRLERQRTEIAMNLHDEIGAGLGSIGLLTDLVASETMDPAEGREVTVRVGEISRGLSRSLSNIVWTLRTASSDLAGFAQFLRQRAADLLSGVDTRIEFDFPDPVPFVRMSLAVRQQVHAIASEALHNAAKYAQAKKVRVALEPDGATWILRIVDDGVGFDAAAASAGLGLESMNRRAAAIGARWTLETRPGAGCRIELRFRPHGKERP